MIFTERPSNFKNNFIGVLCLLECKGKILLLLRSPHASFFVNRWSVPFGKMDQGQDPKTAIVSKLKEEIGYTLEDESRLQNVQTVWVRFPSLCEFQCHIFHLWLDDEPEIGFDHQTYQNYTWMRPSDAALHPDLVQDLSGCIAMCYGDTT
jgi:8-oxo-dGTP pyrophosphatase MutT (NUDIX family)